MNLKPAPAPHSLRKRSGGLLFVAYKGVSMNPTLAEAEIIEVEPYRGRPVRAGDVVYFQVPGKSHRIVHRVIRISPEGVLTQGDDNPRPDSRLLDRADILGKVIGAWRGQKRHSVLGGGKGLLLSRWLRFRPVVRQAVARALGPAYRHLARWGVGRRLLPSRWRPRLVMFQDGPGQKGQLMIGRHRVGSYDSRLKRWRIRPPYRLFVDEQALPGTSDRK